jgi:hypothetical protein
MGGCELPEVDTQRPCIPKCGQAKTKIDLFRDFLQKLSHEKQLSFFRLDVQILDSRRRSSG